MLSVALAVLLAAASPPPSRRVAEAEFLKHVKRNETASDMTSNVLGHTGDHVAYTCTIEELTQPGIAVGQCGANDEPVDLYLELPPGKWTAGQRVRVLGIMDRPGSWSDVSGHTIYYPFVKAVFVDRLR